METVIINNNNKKSTWGLEDIEYNQLSHVALWTFRLNCMVKLSLNKHKKMGLKYCVIHCYQGCNYPCITCHSHHDSQTTLKALSIILGFKSCHTLGCIQLNEYRLFTTEVHIRMIMFFLFFFPTKLSLFNPVKPHLKPYRCKMFWENDFMYSYIMIGACHNYSLQIASRCLKPKVSVVSSSNCFCFKIKNTVLNFIFSAFKKVFLFIASKLAIMGNVKAQR